jgi:hypothetical protein
MDLRQTLNMTLSNALDPKNGIDFFAWFTKMQHYYAPTRCLDWSTSAIVATYFACQDDSTDGAIWIADNNKIAEYNESNLLNFYFNDFPKEFETKYFGLKDYLDKLMKSMNRSECVSAIFNFLSFHDEKSVESIQFLRSLATNERIEAQQGFFSICTNPLLDHKIELTKAGALSQIIVPKKSKIKILSQLYSLNINANTLFPGIDGLGQSIQEFCILWDSKRKII